MRGLISGGGGNCCLKGSDCLAVLFQSKGGDTQCGESPAVLWIVLESFTALLLGRCVITIVERHLANLIIGLCLVRLQSDGTFELRLGSVRMLGYLKDPPQPIVGSCIVRASLEIRTHILLRRRHVLQVHLDMRFRIKGLQILGVDCSGFVHIAVRIAKQTQLVFKDAQIQQERKAPGSFSLCGEKCRKRTVMVAVGTLLERGCLSSAYQHLTKLDVATVAPQRFCEIWQRLGLPMLIQQEVAQVGLCQGQIWLDRKCFVKGLFGFRWFVLLYSHHSKERPRIRIAGIPLQKRLQRVSCLGGLSMLEKTASPLKSIGRLRRHSQCGHREGDDEGIEDSR